GGTIVSYHQRGSHISRRRPRLGVRACVLLHGGRARVGALLVLLTRPTTAADGADHRATHGDGRGAEGGQHLTLEYRGHHHPEAALSHHLRQLLVPAPEGGGRHGF